MPKPLGLRLYMMKAGREASPALETRPRPAPDAVIWLNAGSESATAAMRELAAHIHALREDIGVVLTCSGDAALVPEQLRLLPLQMPSDTPKALTEFVKHYRPSAVLTCGGPLSPALVQCAHDLKVAVFMAEARRPTLPRNWTLWPGFSQDVLDKLSRIFLFDEAYKGVWLRLGASPNVLEVTGPLATCPGALLCNDAERSELADRLHLRPVWLAAATPHGEEALVAAAHRDALRLSHRLLLILHPANPARGPALRDFLSAEFEVALRSEDQKISPETQIYIADTAGERGLWYRLAPVTYMGGSFTQVGSTLDPMEAAALGSAVLHGPEHGPHRASFRKLFNARGAHAVSATSQLADAVTDTMSPDRAALLAHAAWRVVSDGSEATDIVARALIEAVDKAEVTV
jgi:3-deoxy-D-manno-octulosonic-acid transferase